MKIKETNWFDNFLWHKSRWLSRFFLLLAFVTWLAWLMSLFGIKILSSLGFNPAETVLGMVGPCVIVAWIISESSRKASEGVEQLLHSQECIAETEFFRNASKFAKLGVVDMFETRSDSLKPEAAIELLRNAKNIDLMTVAFQAWTDHPAVGKVLQDRAQHSCQIRIVLVHPEKQLGALFRMKEYDHVPSDLGDIRVKAKQFLNLLCDVYPCIHEQRKDDKDARTKSDVRLLHKHHHFLSYSLLRIDDVMYVTSYLHLRQGNWSPTIVLRRGQGCLWNTYLEEFEIIFHDVKRTISLAEIPEDDKRKWQAPSRQIHRKPRP
jgi:hypothetical protein